MSYRLFQPQTSEPKLTCRLDWLGNSQLLDLVPYTKDPQLSVEDGGRVSLSGGTGYLSHAPGPLKSRPTTPLPSPSAPVQLEGAIESNGLKVALWIMEFCDEDLVATNRWPFRDGRCLARWIPSPESNGVRLAIRLEGSGIVDSITLAAKDAIDEESIANRIWTSLNQPRHLLKQTSYPVFKLGIDIDNGYGVDPTALKLNPDRSLTNESLRKLADRAIEETFLEFDSPYDQPVICSYVEHALKYKEYKARCPFTGSSLTSSDTFLVSEPTGRPYIFVRYETDRGVFYDIYAPFSGAKVGYYFVNENLVISSLNLIKIVRVFKAMCIMYANDVQAYLLRRERRTAVALNVMSHWGHVFYDELEAIQWLIENKMDSYVDLWLESDTAFFRVEELFPELSKINKVFAGGRDALFRYILEEHLFVVRPQYAYACINEPTIDRIRTYVHAKAERTGRASAIQERLGSSWPVLWFEIRANDRFWLDQAEGIPIVIRKLQERYPKIGVVLGGWSRLLSNRAEDDRIIAAERPIARSIVEKLDDVPCEVALGLPLWEKSYLAMSCHAGVTVFGSGMTFPWIAKIPKLVLTGRYFSAYVNSPVLSQLHAGPNNASVFLPVEESGSGNSATSNFHYDADKLAEYLDEKILSHLSPPSA